MLKDKVCVITGSGRGIGREAALIFAEEGGKIVVTDLDEAPAVETANEIKNKGGEAIAVPGDITAKGFPEKLIESAVEAFSSVDVIVNNAGYTWDSVIHKMSDEQWEKIMAVHITAPFKILRAAAPHIRAAAKKEIEKIADNHFNQGIKFYTEDNYADAIKELNLVLKYEPQHEGAVEYIQKSQERLQALKSFGNNR